MTTAGWIVMLFSVGFVTAFFILSLYFVLRSDRSRGKK